ncbi:MAG: DUF2807 domain-containing protein [Bacteroidetes bacterium]|nr:DUF2807 domain-containing protein [Bacteroidota bacterium]
MSKLSAIGIFILIIAGYFIFYKGWNNVTLSGTTVTETRSVKPFTKLKLDGVFKTIISQDGGPESVKITGDRNLQRAVVVSNEDDVLTIATRSNMHMPGPSHIVVYVNIRQLTDLSNSSVGAVESKGVLNMPALKLETDAVGKTKLQINTEHLTADLNSVGAIELSGTARTAEISNNSVGKLNAYELVTETLDLKNDAVGAAEIYASKELTIDHRGVGAVHYKGGAKLKSLNDDGVGKVTKAED